MDQQMMNQHENQAKKCDTCDMERHGGCGCMCHKAIPVLMILFALLFLLETLGVVSYSLVNIGWPVLVGIAGFMKLGSGKCSCCA